MYAFSMNLGEVKKRQKILNVYRTMVSIDCRQLERASFLPLQQPQMTNCKVLNSLEFIIKLRLQGNELAQNLRKDKYVQGEID